VVISIFREPIVMILKLIPKSKKSSIPIPLEKNRESKNC
jgi:hypothetical protein